MKSIIDFDEEQSNSIKSLAVEVKTTVAITTRFMKVKILMFAKNFPTKSQLRHDKCICVL